MKNILFNFEDIKPKGSAVKKITNAFFKAGVEIAQVEVGTPKRTSGISYVEVFFVFKDSQKITMRVKNTGDIYQVLLNDKILPIKNQDDHKAAIGEMVDGLNDGRIKFQRKLAAVKVALPPSIKTATRSIKAILEQKVAKLEELVAEAQARISKLQGGA